MCALSQDTREQTSRDSPEVDPKTALREIEAEELTHISPEGRPADPRIRGRALAVLVGVAIGVVITSAALIARAGNPGLAIAVGLVGVIIVLLANPVIWAGALRARERDKVHHRHEPEAQERS